jgi:threonine dehydrogenase-like Zn-dependent dehydrogenase
LPCEFNIATYGAQEPASCAIHGADVLKLPVGSDVLVIGAGPTGLLLAQLLKLNGAAKLVLAANAGPKMKIAREIEAADVYVDLDRKDAKSQWEQLKKDYPYGALQTVLTAGLTAGQVSMPSSRLPVSLPSQPMPSYVPMLDHCAKLTLVQNYVKKGQSIGYLLFWADLGSRRRPFDLRRLRQEGQGFLEP